MTTNNGCNRRSYLKLAGVSVGTAVTTLQSGVASANTATADAGGYGLSSYGLSEYGGPTADGPVLIRTDTATDVSQTSARLAGTVTDLGGASSAEIVFEWGPLSSGLENRTDPQILSEIGGVTADIADLTPGTTYAFRIVAVGTNGTTATGFEQQFTTTTVTTDVDSETTLLPRDGELVNAQFESNHDGYTGDGFVNFGRSDSSVQWDLTTDSPGAFDLTIRYAMGGSEDRTALLVAGDSRREVTIPSTGGWNAWETHTERVMLPEGVTTVEIETTGEDFGNVDSVTLQRVTVEEPTTKTLLPRDGELRNAQFDSNHDGYNGDGFVNFGRSDSYVQWTVESSTTTEYELTIRYALRRDERIGRLTAGGASREVTAASTGSWTNWQTITEQVTLPAGQSLLRIETVGQDFGNLDMVTLTPSAEPSETTWNSQTLLPRDGELVNARSESNHDGYTGDGFVNFDRSDSSVQWEVDADTPAEFDLTIRYALKGSEARTGLLVAGDSQREVTVPSTGRWNAWETHTEPISLPDGVSTVRIEATGQDFGNVDAVRLDRVL